MAACSHCGVSLAHGARTCDRCGAPVPPSWDDPRQVPEPPPFAAPADWVEHRDAWRGFRLYHPRGWQVQRTDGPTLVSGDPQVRACAIFWPMPLSHPGDLRAVAARYVQWRQHRSGVPVQAMVDPTGRLLRLREGPLESQLGVVADGHSALLSGIQAPRGSDTSALLGVVASFAPLPATPRYLWVEPAEGAFAVEVPAGWASRGHLDRNNAYGTPQSHFEAWGDEAGLVRVRLSGHLYNMFDPGAGGGMLGTLMGLGMGMPPMLDMMGIPAEARMPYQTAEGWIRQRYLPGLRRTHPDAVLVQGGDLPDLARAQEAELARRGMVGRCSYGQSLVRFTQGRVPVLQRGRVQTVIVPVVAAMPGTPQPWTAEEPQLLQAPEAEFARLLPLLEGVAESVRANHEWNAREEARVQGYVAASQADRSRRLGEISRTLAETSDLVTGGYWERQRITEHLSHDWSNAIRGYEDRVSSSGEIFNVPSGYDRVFRDNQGTFYGSGWLVDPDPTWQELKLFRR